MRKIVWQAMQEAVQERMESELPQFKPEGRSPRSKLLRYVWKPYTGLSCFVAFRGLESEGLDAFVGWSTSGAFPFGVNEPIECDADIWNFDVPFILRWSMDFVPREGSSFWSFWVATDELLDDPAEFGRAYAEHFTKNLSHDQARALVEVAVSHAVREVREFGVPYLEQRARYVAKAL